MSDLPENMNRIEDIKRSLYNREEGNATRRKEGVLHQITRNVPNSWKGTEEDVNMKKPSSFGKKFFMIAVLFFVVAVAFSLFMFFRGAGTVSNDNIDITVLGNAFTQGGEELPLQIEIINRNNANLELANLIVEYPRGASTDANDTVRLPRESIGTIAKGERVIRNEKVVLYGDQNSVRTIVVRLEYHPQGSNAIFTKESQFPVTISQAPISLTMDGPTQTSSNQEVTFTINTYLNTTLPQEGTVLRLDYPSGFTFTGAIPNPTISNNTWSLTGLTQTTPLSIVVKGIMIGQDGDEQAFHVYAGTKKANDQSAVDVVYNSLLHVVDIKKPFLEAHIAINGDDSDHYASEGGRALRADVVWSNNLPTRITNTEIAVNFSGSAYDKESVQVSDGFFDSVNNKIVWNKNTNSELGSVEPGGKGHLSFSFVPLPVLGGSSSIKDPQVVMDISIKGSEASSGDGIAGVNNFERKTVKVYSNLQLAASAEYASGPMPPVAEQQTIYKVVWTLSNPANAISNGQAKAILPPYVKFIGMASNSAENVVYNDVSHEITWNIGTIRAGTGFGSIEREISFNIGLTPSVSQVGRVPQLVKDVYVTGTDSFASIPVTFSRGPLNTRLENDPSYKPGFERVVK